MLNLTSTDSFCFTKLTGMNYTEWATNMKLYLKSKYLWLITDGQETYTSKPKETQQKKLLTVEWRVEKRQYLDWQL
ncbi:hypothetical protein ID866_10546 [Astraeus odoratus]|nr:hypothetical protein ID866_10546 [Astraeus odoratus]